MAHNINLNSSRGYSYDETFRIIWKLGQKTEDYIKTEIGDWYCGFEFSFIEESSPVTCHSWDSNASLIRFYGVLFLYKVAWTIPNPENQSLPFYKRAVSGLRLFSKDIDQIEKCLNDKNEFKSFACKRINPRISTIREIQKNDMIKSGSLKPKEPEQIDNWKNGLDLI